MARKRISDPAHEETERLIKNMERKVTREYTQAVNDMQKKLDKYFERFAVKDAKKKAEVEAGTISKDAYIEWRKNQMLVGDRWKEMRDILSRDLHNANRIARSIVNGYMPEAYATNFNYGVFQVEKLAHLNTSFTLYNRHTVERILRDNPQLLQPPGKQMEKTFGDFDAYKSGKPVKIRPQTQKAFDKLIKENRDIRWQEGKLQSVTFQSVVQGESIPNMARRIAATMGEMNRKASIRYARTAMTEAQNAGRVASYERCKDMGIGVKHQWMATHDSITRDSHVLLDGEIVEVGEEFSNGCRYPGDPQGDPSEIWNCFVPETSVAANCDIIRTYKHFYNGKLVTIKTAGGVNFTCTPNHPILTLRGWIHADALNDGDNILVTRIRDRKRSWRNPYINHVFTRFDALHELFNVSGTKRTCNLGVNFHGDIPTSDVEIVSKKRFLRKNGNARRNKHINKFLLKSSNSLVFCKRHFVSCFGRIRVSSFCFVRSLCKPFSFFFTGLRHSEKHGLRPVALFDSYGVKPLQDNISGNMKLFSECLDGFTGIVFSDDIVSVDVCSGSTHVYNLQSENGYYFVNSSIPENTKRSNGIMAIAHNCRCTLVPVLTDYDFPTSLAYDGEIDGMTYEEWKESRRR